MRSNSLSCSRSRLTGPLSNELENKDPHIGSVAGTITGAPPSLCSMDDVFTTPGECMTDGCTNGNKTIHLEYGGVTESVQYSITMNFYELGETIFQIFRALMPESFDKFALDLDPRDWRVLFKDSSNVFVSRDCLAHQGRYKIMFLHAPTYTICDGRVRTEATSEQLTHADVTELSEKAQDLFGQLYNQNTPLNTSKLDPEPQEDLIMSDAKNTALQVVRKSDNRCIEEAMMRQPSDEVALVGSPLLEHKSTVQTRSGSRRKDSENIAPGHMDEFGDLCTRGSWKQSQKGSVKIRHREDEKGNLELRVDQLPKKRIARAVLPVTALTNSSSQVSQVVTSQPVFFNWHSDSDSPALSNKMPTPPRPKPARKLSSRGTLLGPKSTVQTRKVKMNL